MWQLNKRFSEDIIIGQKSSDIFLEKEILHCLLRGLIPDFSIKALCEDAVSYNDESSKRQGKTKQTIQH